MPSTESRSGQVESQMGWSYCYGLPLWMRSNFDRLNVSTDFEKYACSPPETDSGFIPDFDAKFSSALAGEQLSNHNASLKNSKSSPTICDLERSAQHHELCKALKEAAGQGFLANSAVPAVPRILGCHSSSTSTDTTPSTTPQSSPFNSRKTLSKEDALPSNNSRKWFYSRVLSERMSEAMPVVQENADSAPSVKTVKKPNLRKKPLVAKGCRKYVMSNFDLNAVSPTSW